MKRPTTRSIYDIARSYQEDVSERQRVGGIDVIGIPTGFEIVDELTGGLQKDQMWIIASRTSVGKTAMALSVAIYAGKPTLFYSLEMRGEVLVNRLLSTLTGIPAGRIKRGKLSDQEMRTIRQATEQFQDSPIYVIDQSMTSEQLQIHAWEEADKRSIELVMVDNAHIFADKSGQSSVTRMSEISNRIRNLARPDQLDCPVVLLAQLNRASEIREDHRPVLSDLKDSGSLEQDAEVVLFPFRPYLYERMKGAEPKDEERDAEIIIAKNREGPVMTTKAVFHANKMQWTQTRAQPVEPKPVPLVEQARRKRS